MVVSRDYPRFSTPRVLVSPRLSRKARRYSDDLQLLADHRAMVLERDEGIDVAWSSALHRGDHVHVALPRPLGVEYRRVRGVVGMAVVVPEDVELGAVVLLADLHVLPVVDQVSHLRLLALYVAHGPHLGDERILRPADEQAADLVRVALGPMALDRLERA